MERITRTTTVGVLLLVFSTLAPAAILNYSQVFVLGDSLSDSGNVSVAIGGATTNPPYTSLIPSAPYSSGRFSNGPVWVEQLANNLGLSAQASLTGGTGYAFGGARTGPLSGVAPSSVPTLLEQKDMLLQTFGTLPGDALYIVWGGSNDVRDAVETANTEQAARIIQDALGNISAIISSMAEAGAQQFLVPNLPDLSLTPAVKAAAEEAGIFGPLLLAAFKDASTVFNDTLTDSVLPGLETGFGIDITELDIEAEISEVVAQPGDFGLLNASDSCIIIGSDACSDPDGYLFWDGLHPTMAGHSLISDLAYNQLATVPLPTALPLFLFGISLFGFYARKRC